MIKHRNLAVLDKNNLIEFIYKYIIISDWTFWQT